MTADTLNYISLGGVREQCLMVQRLSLGDGNALGVLVNVLNAPKLKTYAVQFTQSCPTLFDPMDCSSPGFPVHHQLPELT